MTEKTVTRADLADSLYQQLGLSRSESAELVDSVFEEMTDALLAGENVKISGFGSFILRDKKGRVGRNPKTGVEAHITPRRVLVFKASHLLKEEMNKG
jgi:integration host factor subunit alpha